MPIFMAGYKDHETRDHEKQSFCIDMHAIWIYIQVLCFIPVTVPEINPGIIPAESRSDTFPGINQTIVEIIPVERRIYREMAGETAGEIIPPDRCIDWDPGIPGGIPLITGPLVNILDHGADPTGTGDSHPAIINAIAALPAPGGVVYIPEGSFRVTKKIGIGRDGIVFRGTGRKSRLLIGSEGACFEVSKYQRGNWQQLPLGAAKGDSVLLVADGSLFTPGEFAEVEQDNDSSLMYTRADWIVSWAEHSVGQLFEVMSISGNLVTLRTPVHVDFSTELNARVRPMGLVRQVGFEDLYVEKTVAADHTFLFKNTAYCWIRNVESNHTRRTHVHLSVSLGNEVRDSYFHRSFDYGGGGSGYGVECGFHTTGCLVENNIFDSLRHAMMVQVGANGNVFGYNYSINPVQGDGETNLNQGWDPPDISIHGHYPFMNLFEGNEVEEIGIGDYWGPAGPGNTYFRNRVNGEGILCYDASHGQNIIGNITATLEDKGGQCEEMLWHGNVVNGTGQWDPGIPEHNLPPSLYLDSVPDFFGETFWPSFGPDVATGVKLPAQTRFENLPFLTVTADRDPVGRYERIEFTIGNGKTYANPFDPDEADIYGIFLSPSGDSLRVNAFWDGSGWKLRFAGAETGEWKTIIHVEDGDGLETQAATFTVVGSDEKGWITVSERDPHYLSTHDGSPFFGIGMAVPWLVYDSRYYPQPGLLERLAGYGVNFINWLFTSWDILLVRDSYDRYSMADAVKFDRLIQDAEQQGIKLLLGIWIHDLLREAPHPWNGFYDWDSNPFNELTSATGFFSDSTSWAYQQKYYRYIIARWGYSTSVGMWHTVAEINGTNAIYDPLAMTTGEKGWHSRIDRYFRENDPFGHPTTVSGSGGYDFSDGWEVTVCPQVHEYPYPRENTVQNADRIAMWSDRLFRQFEKPVFVGEFGKSLYEEGKSERFLHDGIWAGVLSGSCVTPLHWWGGQISSRPENFSTFNETMMQQILYLKRFLQDIDMTAHRFEPLYGASPSEKITLSGLPEGKVYGLRGDSLSLCWVYRPGDDPGGDYSGVGLTIPGLDEGTYQVSFYNPWSGEWDDLVLEPETVNGVLEFTCPPFTGDIALKIEYAGPAGPASSSDAGENWTYSLQPETVKLYPNPCSTSFTIESVVPIQSISLLDSAGKVLMMLEPENRSSLQIDLSTHDSGLYLLRIRDQGGYTFYRKVLNL
jgi:hypothetical protein